MTSSISNSSADESTPLKVPRLASLQHRLQTAKDAKGKPIPLIDELLFLLDDPPPGTVDRWQAGADLCADHGIKTSRMSVWRFYHANIIQWRREQIPPPPEPPVDPREITRLENQARYLAAQRALDLLNDPRLSPTQLFAFLRKDNQRQRIQLARDQFDDRVTVRVEHEQREATRQYREAVEKRAFYEKFGRPGFPSPAVPPPTAP